MAAYDSNLFDPPAPVALVSIRDPGSGNVVSNVRMLLDSGSDLTLIPERLINDLNLEVDQSTTFELTGFDGQELGEVSATRLGISRSDLQRTFRGY